MSAKDIGAELRKYLLADTALAAAFGSRITPCVIDQAATRPAAMYKTISGMVEEALSGATGTQKKRVQWDVLATTDKQAQGLAGDMITRFAGFRRGQMNSTGGVWIQELSIASAVRTEATPPGDGSTDWDYWASFDVLVTYSST